MKVNKKALVVATCKACGWHGKLDNCHKLATYISKNPPAAKDKTIKKDKKDKKEHNDKKLKKGKKDHQENKDEKKEAGTYSGSDEKESEEKEEYMEEEDLRHDGRIMSGVVKEFVELVEKNEHHC